MTNRKAPETKIHNSGAYSVVSQLRTRNLKSNEYFNKTQSKPSQGFVIPNSRNGPSLKKVNSDLTSPPSKAEILITASPSRKKSRINGTVRQPKICDNIFSASKMPSDGEPIVLTKTDMHRGAQTS